MDELPAGFASIATPPYLVDESDYMINEFFILRPSGGKGIGEQAAIEIFNQFRGKWMLFTTLTDKNRNTIHFWRKTLARYTNDHFTEDDKELIDEEIFS